MGVRSFDATTQRGHHDGEGTDPRVGGGSTELKYRLDLVGPSVLDVVKYAGGWLFDRVSNGWTVTVLTDDPSDDRALKILGAEKFALEPVLGSSWDERRRPQTLAVAADLFANDARVRRGVLKAIRGGMTEVTLWGESCPAEWGRSGGPVRHVLSDAARAFKAHALAAADDKEAGAVVGDVEVFRAAVLGQPSAAASPLRIGDSVKSSGPQRASDTPPQSH